MLNGDLDHDGQITVADIVIMSNIVLQNRSAEVISGDFTIEEPTPTYTIYYGTAAAPTDGTKLDGNTYDITTGNSQTTLDPINITGDVNYKWVAIPSTLEKTLKWTEYSLTGEDITDEHKESTSRTDGYVMHWIGSKSGTQDIPYWVTFN